MKKIISIFLIMVFVGVLYGCNSKPVVNNDYTSEGTEVKGKEDIIIKYWNSKENSEPILVKYDGIEEDFKNIIKELEKVKAEDSCECIRENNFDSGDIILSFDNISNNKMHIRVNEKKKNNTSKDYYLNMENEVVNRIQEFYDKSMENTKEDIKNGLKVTLHEVDFENGELVLEDFSKEREKDFDGIVTKLNNYEKLDTDVKFVKPISFEKNGTIVRLSTSSFNNDVDYYYVSLIENNIEKILQVYKNDEINGVLYEFFKGILLEKEIKIDE
ncbi:hypothetical protein [Miniphocaeibacter halophilus]|uniref:Uncharacterized protein n=1 Tax=Miniphocaeibacter halophilus TaxID=2931922 RepID=A0AC61MRS7_9FIRM|nr:hypothetical protein [Miniphocaeibacter halophilus]QQK08023.1 hypothetical protein JFY71_00350 [Miniphocaeibacter halophilus]